MLENISNLEDATVDQDPGKRQSSDEFDLQISDLFQSAADVQDFSPAERTKVDFPTCSKQRPRGQKMSESEVFHVFEIEVTWSKMSEAEVFHVFENEAS